MRLVENDVYQKKTQVIKLFLKNMEDSINKIRKFFTEKTQGDKDSQ